MRIAVIDIGSNAIHLGVVEGDAVGNRRVLARETSTVSLGRGLARTGEIGAEEFQESLEALALMAEVIRGFRCDTILAYGAEPLRQASNAGRFVAEASRLDLPVCVISGEEEARLIFQAAAHAIPFPEEPAVLVDIRGGSTTLTWVLPSRSMASISLPWGPQRLMDALATSDPPTPGDSKRVRRFIRKVLKRARRQLPDHLPGTSVILGTSGTFLGQATAPDPEIACTREQLLRLKRRLWHANAQERAGHLGVVPSLAEASHIGASWMLGIMDWLQAAQVRSVPVGLREGMLWEALEPEGVARPTLTERREASIEALASPLDPDPAHSLQVRRLADQLFLDLQPIFQLGDRERELLGYAARLHDIGLSIGEKEHHKHGGSLVQNADLGGFRPKEVELIAQTVRFHRGRTPSTERHEGFAQLAPWHRTVVEKLSAILRLADALDRSHRQRVRSARIELAGEEVLLRIQGSGDLRLELEGFQDKGTLLFRLLDRPVRAIVMEPRGEAN